MKRTFFDTSILLGGLIDFGPGVEAAQAVMAMIADRRISKPVTAWHCCLEFYSVATRLPPEYRLAPKDAVLLMEEEIVGRFEVHRLPENGRLPLFHESANHRVIGGRIFDAHIGAVALDSGAQILVTENIKHFNALPLQGIDVVSARELLSIVSSNLE